MRCAMMIFPAFAAFGLLTSPVSVIAEDKQPAATEKKADPAPVPLNKKKTVLLDKPNNRVLLKTKVVFREGVLEMLLCKKQMKEHESIVSIDAEAYVIHTGLLALGAKPGTPVQFKDEKFIPPTGTKINVFVQWVDKKDNIHRMRAQKWVRHSTGRFFLHKMAKLPDDLEIPKDSDLRYDDRTKELLWYGTMSDEQKKSLLKLSADKEYRKAIEKFHDAGQFREMKAEWVFAGSGFYVETQGVDKGKRFYRAEGGDVICVANFSTAMMDITAESTSSAGGLVYEAYTERIPPLDTPVTVELVPVLEEKKESPKDG